MPSTKAKTSSNPVQTPSSNGSSFTKEQFEAEKDRIEGLIRGQKINQLEHDLRGEVAITTQRSLKADTQEVKIGIFKADLATAKLQVEGAETKTKIEGHKLRLLKADESGEAQMAEFQEELWEIRIKGRKEDISQSRMLLAEKVRQFENRMIEG